MDWTNAHHRALHLGRATRRRALTRGIASLALSASMLCPHASSAQVATSPSQAATPAPYRNFRAAIYIAVGNVHPLADRATFERQYARATSQLHIDKVYIEAYRDHDFATDDELERVKGFFREKGVAIAGGITLAAGDKSGQFGTFDYELPEDRAECERAVRLAAKHFDEVILDDFFFYTSKSPADIAAKGKRSWTQYRLDTKRRVARDLVLNPAHAANPRVRMIIKYPNWYEHFQGLGYDLDQEAKAFDGIYTGTETRDPTLTDQLLQQYESYEIIRYYDNIRPGANGGGWVDTASTRDIDRYAEQLWDTLFAKAPQVMLFEWRAMTDAGAAEAGDRPWAQSQTSFDWRTIPTRWRATGAPFPPGWGRAAGAAFEAVDPVLGFLGNPIGVASYKPYQSSGEDFLHNYLGTLGLPIELSPTYPTEAPTVLLTAAAAADPAIVDRMKASLMAGHDLVVTSGLVSALGPRGFADIAEWTPTGLTVSIDHFVAGYGAGNGTSLDDAGVPPSPTLFQDFRFYTNDSWAIVRGVAGAKGYPVILMNHYGRGTIYMLNVPDNPADLYTLPQGVLAQLKAVAGKAMPLWVDAPPQVSLFAYDNGSFVLESFRAEATTATVHLKQAGASLVELPGATPVRAAPPPPGAGDTNSADTAVSVQLPPHSFRVFRIVSDAR